MRRLDLARSRTLNHLLSKKISSDCVVLPAFDTSVDYGVSNPSFTPSFSFDPSFLT
jgi:hypothetical protein